MIFCWILELPWKKKVGTHISKQSTQASSGEEYLRSENEQEGFTKGVFFWTQRYHLRMRLVWMLRLNQEIIIKNTMNDLNN